MEREEHQNNCDSDFLQEARAQIERSRQRDIERYLGGEVSDWEIVEKIYALSKTIADSDLSSSVREFYHAYSACESPREAMEDPALKFITMAVIERMRSLPTSLTRFKSDERQHVHFLIGKLVNGYGFPLNLKGH